MKTVSRTILGWTVCSLALAACGASKSATSGSQQQVHIQADAQNMDAEQLALAGEQLMAPHSFMLADKVFVMALSKDSGNQRATFYHTFLKPLMLLQGGATRISPLANEAGFTKGLNKRLASLPNSSAKDFLTQGKADLKTADDAQTFMGQYTQAVFDLYDYLKANQTMQITLNMNPFVFQSEAVQRRNDNCVINISNETTVDVVCDASDILQTKVNTADMIALRQMVAGEALYSMMFSTYSISGSETLLPESKLLNGNQVFDKVTVMPGFGRLRVDNKLARLKSLGADLSIAYKWVVKNQANLCPAQDDYGVRRHGYLFDHGVCTQSLDEKYNAKNGVKTLDQLLAGPAHVQLRNGNGDHRATVANPFAFISAPVQDLKNLGLTRDQCGDVMVKDQTFGGALPNGDADFLLKKPGC